MKQIALVLVLALVVGCQCATDCHWGPSYWCQNEATAKECGGTKYCQEKVWKKSTAPVAMVSEPQGVECEICQIVVDFIQKELMDNKTETQVKTALLEFCKSTGPLAGTCVKFVNDEFDKIWNAIINGGAGQACSVLGFCSSAKPSVQEVSRPLKKTQLKGVECTICEKIAEEILKFVESNVTEEEAKVEVKRVCVYLGGFAPECRLLIDAYFDELWDAATSAVGSPNALCQKVKLCNPSSIQTSFMAKIKLPQARAGECDLCKLVVKFLATFVDKNTTEEEVKDAVEKLCALLPGNASESCTSLVKTYFDIIWDILKQEVNSGQVCELVKLCNSSRVTGLAKSQPLPQAPMDSACDLCKLVAAFLARYVDSNTTEEEVKDAVERLCGLLPGNASASCTSLVDTYFDIIWELLKQEVDGGEVCKQLGLCTNLTTLHRKQSVSVKSNEVCDACQMVVKYLRDIVDNSKTEPEVKALIEMLCDKAGPLKDECDSIVDNYLPMVWKLLQSYVDDDQICAEIKLCVNMSAELRSFPQSAIVEVQQAPLRKVGGGVLCMVCELVIKELTSMLDTNTTEQAIESALDKVCGALPSSFKEDCTQFVDKYTPEIVQAILSGLAGKAVCTVMGLCLGSEEQLMKVQGTEECVLCKTVLELAKMMISSKSAEQKVDEIVEKVCVVVPSGIRDECKSFIETFGPQVIELLEKAVDPPVICADIKLCTKTAGATLMAGKY